MKQVAVLFDGPFCDFDFEYGERPVWTVSILDNDDNEHECLVYEDYKMALEYAKKLASKRHLELVIEATQA